MVPTPVEVLISQNLEYKPLPQAGTPQDAPERRSSRDGIRRFLTAFPAGRKRVRILALACLLASAGASAQGVFATPQPVGVVSSAQSVTVTAQAAGSVATVDVVTMGASNLDFQASGASSCAVAVAVPGQEVCSQSVTFKPSAPGLRMGAVVLLDANKNVLGTAYLSGTGSGGLGVLVPGNVLTMAGVYRVSQSTKDGIPATQANLDQPASIAFDGAGNMYIADSSHNRIRKVAAPIPPATVGVISTYAGTGQADYSGDNGLAAAATLDTPSGVALDGAGNLYIADTNNNVIRMIAASTGIITTVAGNGTGGYTADHVLATSAELNSPKGVSVDAGGNLYIADTNNQRIRRVDAVTGIITTVAGDGDPSGKGDGKGTYAGDGGPATSAGLSLPYAVAVDVSGDMYIPDSANNVIRMVAAVNGAITASSVISTVAGFYPGNPGASGDGGLATAAFLWAPSGVAVDPAGNLYISDTQNFRIQKVNAATGKIATLISNNTGSNLAPGGTTPAPVQIYAPVGLFLDGRGNLYFADYYYMLVEQIQSDKAVLNFTKTPVQVGNQSAPQPQTVENDGNAPLDLTAFTPDANAAIDPATTTCSFAIPLAADDVCQIGAVFAPPLSLVFPSGAATEQVDGNIDVLGNTVSYPANTLNFPLDIELVGVATPVNATTLKLTSNPNPSNYGASVTFIATVTSGATAGTPVGSVAFTDTFNTVTTTLAPSVAVNGQGVAVFATTAPLAVGSHTITATFTGATTSNFLPSSNTLIQVVGEVTAIKLATSGTPSALGQSVTFTATVSVTSGGGVPLDGTVTFLDGLTQIGTPQSIGANGIATVSTATLTAGLHTITATYSGDPANGILSSSAAPLAQDVQAPSTVTLTTSGSPSVYGNPVTFTALVSGAAGTPTGNVAFKDSLNGGAAVTLVCTPQPVAPTATCTIATLAVGAHSVTASYSGNSDYAPQVSSPVSQQVNLALTTTTLAAKPNPGIAGAPVTITATVALQGGAPMTGGTVTFNDTYNGATVQLGTPTALSSAGTAAVSSMLAPGSHSILATYSGDANGSGSSATLVLTVNQAVTQTSVTVAPNPALVLATVTFTAKVVSTGGGIPTGSVTFSAGAISIGSAPLDNTGTAKLLYSKLAAGVYTVTAAYSGDTNDQTSTGTAPAQLVVGTIPTVTDLGASTTGGTTPQLILVAAVLNDATGNPGSLPVPTGTITYKSGSTVIGSAILDSSGVATLVPNLPSGSYSIVAAYLGDADHSPSSSAAVSISTTAAGFNLKVTPASVTIETTRNASLNVALTSISGFSDTIGLGCASLPAGVNCHFSSISAKLAANGVQNVTLTIDTNNPLGGGSSAMNAGTASRNFALAGLFLPLSALFGCIFWRFRRRYATAMTTALVLLLGAAALLVTGCSGFSQSSAAPGDYVIQVTGVGANSDISHYQNVTLTITAK